MTFADAVRATEILLAFAFLLQSAEHLAGPARDRALFLARLLLAIPLLIGFAAPWCLLGLALISLGQLHRFDGPYNGGSDRMSILILWCLTAAHWLPHAGFKEVALGYLALQLTLSYFISGWVKLVNPQWREGRALQDVFAFSAYPVSENLRGLSVYPRLCRTASWLVILFEILFPLCLLSPALLYGGLAIAATFHLANACLFGLNRFFWIWLAAYPSLIWFQERFVGSVF